MTDRRSKGGRWGDLRLKLTNIQPDVNALFRAHLHILHIDNLKLRCHATNYVLAIDILMLLPNFLIKAGNLFFLIIIVVEINNFASILKKNIKKSCVCVLIVDINRG
jgi:hypothetical protein